MIKNYFKIAWRNITRHKGYSAINILGLAIGIAACLLILQYVAVELSYENFHANKDRIYRVQQDRYDNGKLSTQWAAGAFAVGNTFKDAIPGIEDYVKLVPTGRVVTEKDNQPVKLEKVFYATGSFFNIFSYPLKHSVKDSILNKPFTAALSASSAMKIFGSTDVVGKPLKLNRNRDYTITAVYEDMPSNTQLQPDILLSYATFVKERGPDNNPEQAWTWDGCLTYLLLRQGADPAAIEKQFPAIVQRATGEELKRFNASVTYLLQPLTAIHLYSHYIMEPGPTGDGKTVYLLMGIAFFIVIIAWVNYINLATARAINRAKEVGIRKAIGSQKKQLIVQFLAESAVLNGIALLLGLVLVLVALPGFNALSGQQLSFSLFASGNFWLALTLLFVSGVFLSGIYPAFVLSGFNPIEVLKGNMISTGKGALLRKGLVVFQFTASLFLLISTFIVYRQIQFMRNQNLGINVDQTLVVSQPTVTNDSTYDGNMAALKAMLLQKPAIQSVSVSSAIPGEPVGWNAGGIKLVGTDESTQKQYRVIGVDYDYLKAYGLKLIAGRAFSKDFGADDKAVIFNRKGLDQLGFVNPQEALGKKIDFWGEQYTIAGVTENFHQQSLKELYEPLIFRLIPDIRGYLSVKTNSQQSAATIAAVKEAWNRFFPGNVFEYFFLDDHFDQQYKADQRFGQVFGVFTALAILVACLGLFGLASFTTLQRKKEIGIRKVLGASVSGILQLLYRDFALLLLIAFVIAVPVALFTVLQWLQGYAFRVNIQWYYFAIPFIAIMLIALITVSFQTIKAAIANPVKSLRTE